MPAAVGSAECDALLQAVPGGPAGGEGRDLPRGKPLPPRRCAALLRCCFAVQPPHVALPRGASHLEDCPALLGIKLGIKPCAEITAGEGAAAASLALNLWLLPDSQALTNIWTEFEGMREVVAEERARTARL